MQDELAKSGVISKPTDTVGVLMTVDEAIEDERKKIKSINRCILFLDAAMTLINFGVVAGNASVIMLVTNLEKRAEYMLWFSFITAIMTGFNAAVLAYASWSIKKSILKQNNLKPN